VDTEKRSYGGGIMSEVKTYHVIPADSSGWRVRAEDTDTGSTEWYLSKNNAIARAMKLASSEELDRAVLVIHRKDGTVERKYTFGNSSPA
jgi:hypothetical protein